MAQLRLASSLQCLNPHSHAQLKQCASHCKKMFKMNLLAVALVCLSNLWQMLLNIINILVTRLLKSIVNSLYYKHGE